MIMHNADHPMMMVIVMLMVTMKGDSGKTFDDEGGGSNDAG